MLPSITCWLIAGVLIFLPGTEAQLLWGLQQPIGIDFSPELITAAYAHTFSNITILAQLRPRDNEPYLRHMVQLRQEFGRDRKLAELYDTKFRHLVRKAWENLRGPLLSRAAAHLTLLENPAVQSSWVFFQDFWGHVTRSQFLYEVRSTARYLLGWTYSLFTFEEDSAEILTLDNLRDDFVGILIRLREQALQNHNIDIQDAFFAVPEYFNATLHVTVLDASDQVGIRSIQNPITRSQASVVDASIEKRSLPEMWCLILDLCAFYLDLRAVYTGHRSGIKDGHLPMDPWRADTIDMRLTDRLVQHSEALQFQLSIEAKKEDLWPRVKRARYLIRNEIDNEDTPPAGDDVYHHDEYPLDLEGWGYQEFSKAEAMLSWGDVQAAEDGYVTSLGDNIRTYLVSLRRFNDNEPENTVPLKIDKVVLLTAGTDGPLLRRAVQHAIGNDVEIVGGTRREFSLAAEGAARIALVRRERQEFYERKMKAHDEL
ncbi:hypothetical protein FE257_000057 [Aspergillus nanangensis]|uniref:Uncharacterized protein n=1 Tax=Aspergillus nanangensis TaxID=2582783 RepID=A0AAD4CYP0_ASPNN|nr:hypothetical protein FE257_000057 [Aspergillus nanangensis]